MFESSINSIVSNITTLILDPIKYILYFLSILYFFWGLTLFIINSDDQSERKKGKDHMIYGLIGFFIIFSVIGILNLIGTTTKTIF